MIYLDYNATSPLLPEVRAAMTHVLGEAMNPSSFHGMGRSAKRKLEDARSFIAHALGAFANEVLFTASGSEANNMVLRAFADRPILVSAIEHASIAKTAGLLGGAKIPVDVNGIVDLAALDAMLASLGKPALVSVMLANNETGVIQDIPAIADIVHKHGSLLHCDAVQALGKIRLDWGLLKTDLLTISPHKTGGPLGAAALLIRNDLPIRALITGGGQELGRRAGTENLVAILGFAETVRQVANCPEAPRLKAMRDALEAALPEALVYSQTVARLPNTSLLIMPGVKSETQLMHFDLSGFAVSSGSACSSGRLEPSNVLSAMGAPAEHAGCALRVSLGWGTTEEDVHKFADCWNGLYAKLGKRAAA